MATGKPISNIDFFQCICMGDSKLFVGLSARVLAYFTSIYVCMIHT